MKPKVTQGMDFCLGSKVIVRGHEEKGFGEVHSYPTSNKIQVTYFTGPDQYFAISVPVQDINRTQVLPTQTRCYFKEKKSIFVGRVLSCLEDNSEPRTYHVQFPNESQVRRLKEDEFNVRSYLLPANPMQTLALLGHETPFFFESRHPWFHSFIQQAVLSHGLTGLISAKIKLMPHQVEIVRRLLQDPVMRYLLADEVGLGKTIEAAIVLRQAKIDFPKAQLAVFAPEALCNQWKDELVNKFDLSEVLVLPHKELNGFSHQSLDMAVIDEAHRVVARTSGTPEQKSLFESACLLARNTRHLLLLSATPVLHYEEELLGLLHLLDPVAYHLEDRDLFRKRLELRRELGRVVMALSAATQPLLIKRHAKQLAQLLENDLEVKHFVSKINDTSDKGDNEIIPKLSKDLQIHVSETYRVYRRMLRTRRRLLGESGLFNLQRVERSIEYELEEEMMTRLWCLLEEWRIQVAFYSRGVSEQERRELIALYIQMAYALSLDLSVFRAHLAARCNILAVQSDELEILRQMLETIDGSKNVSMRVDLLISILRNRIKRDPVITKHVIFCSLPKICAWIVSRLREIAFDIKVISVHSLMDRSEIEKNLREFKYDSNCRFLITDSCLEEGINLQFAQGLIMYDLPWDPMRIEQRLGRLDRIDRVENVFCQVILTLEDESQAVDAAWHKLITEGLGVFSGSISDLQFLVEREVSRLKQIAFEGGPGALVAEVERVKEDVKQERSLASEQDVIDGLHLGEIKDSPFFNDLKVSEEKSEEFERNLDRYLDGNLGLEQEREGRIIRYKRKKNLTPLIPVDRLLSLSGLFLQSTTDRQTALRRPDLQFLRVGNPFVDHIKEISDWDERGRAYAMWREVKGLTETTVVFRINILACLDLERVKQKFGGMSLDRFSCSSIIRMVSSWFPTQIFERFSDEVGKEIKPSLISVCKTPYWNQRDINLSQERCNILLDLFGKSTWARICEDVSEKAIEKVKQDQIYLFAKKKAQELSHQYFAVSMSRLRFRSYRAIENSGSLERILRLEEELATMVNTVIEEPQIKVDSIGLYVLSEKPICQR